MKRVSVAWVLLVVAACGDGVFDSSVEPNLADTPVAEVPAADLAVDDADDVPEPPGEPADDVAVGEPIELGEPPSAPDPCAEEDVCPAAASDAPDDPSLDPASTGEYMPGEVLITLRYAAMRTEPDADAARTAVHSGGGTHEGHPAGTIPPGQAVTVLDAPRTGGYYLVRYKGVDGWVHRNKLQAWDRTIHPLKFAQQAAVRDAFFMHQIRRSAWNKDGPSSSGNCAPTSLAMAAKIFGKAGVGKTVEQTIHQARDSYGAVSNENQGTFRYQIVRGAQKLGLDVKELGTNLSVADELDRIDNHLARNRAIVLEGQPGSAYRGRMTEAFKAGGSSRSYTFSGTHSILVVAKFDSGKYLIADPISEVGMVTMARSELKSFIATWGGTGTVVWDAD